MSFSDDDKEALGEDLDELKSSLTRIEQRVTGIHKNLGTLVTMAWVYIILSVVLGVAFGVMVVSAGG
jgi:hypothetical protein